MQISKKYLIWTLLLLIIGAMFPCWVRADISIKRPAPDLTPIDKLTNIAWPSVITIMDHDLSDPRGVLYFQRWNNYGFVPNPKATLIKQIWHD